MILNTEIGSRRMLPDFGSRLKSLLFEPNDGALVSDITREINYCLGKWEPRIIVLNVDVSQDFDNHTAYITVQYKIPISGGSDIVKLLIK